MRRRARACRSDRCSTGNAPTVRPRAGGAGGRHDRQRGRSRTRQRLAKLADDTDRALDIAARGMMMAGRRGRRPGPNVAFVRLEAISGALMMGTVVMARRVQRER